MSRDLVRFLNNMADDVAEYVADEVKDSVITDWERFDPEPDDPGWGMRPRDRNPKYEIFEDVLDTIKQYLKYFMWGCEDFDDFLNDDVMQKYCNDDTYNSIYTYAYPGYVNKKDKPIIKDKYNLTDEDYDTPKFFGAYLHYWLFELKYINALYHKAYDRIVAIVKDRWETNEELATYEDIDLSDDVLGSDDDDY